MAKKMSSTRTSRDVVIVRHGERCDFVFNRGEQLSWVQRAFDSQGKYTPFDINLPRNIPKRKNGPEAYEHDSPLTEMGYLQCKLVGRAMRDENVDITSIYCSPALRCIQTAVGIVKGMGLGSSKKCDVRINVEPGLFEWMMWCRGRQPEFLDDEDLNKLAAGGYPINTNYVRFYETKVLKLDEPFDSYWRRSSALVKSIINNHNEGTVLIVGHSGSPDTLSRELCGNPKRTMEDFYTIIRNIPYLSTLRLTEHPRKGWQIAGSPIQPMTHGMNPTFDPTIFTMTTEELTENYGM